MHAIMIGLDQQIWHNEQLGARPQAAWTGWNYLSEAGSKGLTMILAEQANGRMHAIMIGFNFPDRVF